MRKNAFSRTQFNPVWRGDGTSEIERINAEERRFRSGTAAIYYRATMRNPHSYQAVFFLLSRDRSIIIDQQSRDKRNETFAALFSLFFFPNEILKTTDSNHKQKIIKGLVACNNDIDKIKYIFIV